MSLAGHTCNITFTWQGRGKVIERERKRIGENPAPNDDTLYLRKILASFYWSVNPLKFYKPALKNH